MIKFVFPEKNISRIILFWVCYLLLIATCLFAFVQFLPKKFWWFGWGISASVVSFMLTRYFIGKEAKPFEYRWMIHDRLTLLRFLSGLSAGMLIIIVIVFILTKTLHLQIVNSITTVKDFLIWSTALIPCAFHEELGFRYFTLKKLGEKLSPLKCQLITAIVFALYHIIGGQDILNAFFSTTLWSVIYVMSAWYSKGLALPVGIHAGSTIGQAFFGLKIQEGFPSIYTLAPTGSSSPYQQSAILISQAIVLIITISIMMTIHYFIKEKK